MMIRSAEIAFKHYRYTVRIFKRPKARFWLRSRCFLSSEAPSSDASSLFPLSITSLDLDASLVRPHLDSIRQLPEIETSLQAQTVEPLKRAVEIFETIGGKEHQAVLALLAEVYQRQGSYDEALSTLRDLKSHLKVSSRLVMDVDLAQSKLLWLQGQFADAKQICDDLLENPALESLHYASARTGQAITRLSSCRTLDDAFSVRDPARMVVKFLEGQYNTPLASATAQLNFGIAEAIYAEVVSRENNVQVPLDGAMRAWRQGLTILKRHQRRGKQSKRQETLAAVLQARLKSNMAWGLLQMTNERDYVKQASEYAGEALQVYDKMTSEPSEKEGLGRTLSLVATCYHKSSMAVTAEGLFQSAIDQPAVSPLQKLELRDTYKFYSTLCREWEKRERDADRLEQQGVDMNESLPEAWKGKSSIHSSLWFWTPNLFVLE